MYFFIGSYTDEGSPAPEPKGAGISYGSFDPFSGTIKFLGSHFQRNPSFPIVSADGATLYAAEEMFATGNPKLVAYRILEDGSLNKLNEAPLEGDYACHLAIANQTILVANYVSGDILVYTLEDDGKIGALTQRIWHSGSGIHKERQEAPHPHMMYAQDDQIVYCVDLGIDMVKAYGVEASSGNWRPRPELDIKVNDGAGARHMDMNRGKDTMTILGELSGELSLYHKKEEYFELTDSVCLGNGDMSAAAIKIHANERFIYISERKNNRLYGFMILNNRLQRIGHFSSRGTTPRDISIDPTGRWLLAANQDSNAIAVFSIDTQSGELQFVRSYDVATPSCICWQYPA